jgi:hypothetical protein
MIRKKDSFHASFPDGRFVPEGVHGRIDALISLILEQRIYINTLLPALS